MKIVRDTMRLHNIFGIEKAIDTIADAGFDGLDYTDTDCRSWEDDYKEFAKLVREKAESRGMAVYQTHAPTPTGLLKKGGMDFVKERTIRSIEFASLLGAEAVVVHPIQDPAHKLGDESVFERNMDYFGALLPCCEKLNIKISIENMCKTNPKSGIVGDGVCAHPHEFIRYIDALGSKYVTGCMDTGHCAATGREPQDVLRIVGGDRITCLHIHDTDYKRDMHYLPYTVDLDWDEICKALADIDYKGHFTMEACNFITKVPVDFIPTALKYEYDVAKYLADKVEKYKSMK